ncbi:MAG: hypothetical protein M3P49_08390 [Actinomycetota bacterium]|nr:hypothetical protein [Actinomycetota bacterium]
MNKDSVRRAEEEPTEEHLWITPEEVAASAPRFGSREELVEVLEDKGWAVFVSADGGTVAGAPRGNPTRGGCLCCSGVEAVALDGEGLMLTGACAVFASSVMWGGSEGVRGFTLVHQGANQELADVTVLTDELPTPEQAEEIMRQAAMRNGASS